MPKTIENYSKKPKKVILKKKKIWSKMKIFDP
jgi:hypothetical protein